MHANSMIANMTMRLLDGSNGMASVPRKLSGKPTTNGSINKKQIASKSSTAKNQQRADIYTYPVAQ
jgi:hypothetical protein